MKVGDIALDGIRDGTAYLPPGFFGSSTNAHGGTTGIDGGVELPIACFVVRTTNKTMLLDAGVGPVEVQWQPEAGGPLRLEGGLLPKGLAALGLSPSDIDIILLSHLHADHSGWLWHDDRPYFPNATVRFGRDDWRTFIEGGTPGADASAIRALAELGSVELIDQDGGVAPHITALHTPGHTPGHQTYILSSGHQRALFLGDALSCPLQMQAPELEALADMDRALGIKTRARILQEIESDDLIGGPHFPEVRFGRVIKGDGRGYWN